MPPRRPHRPAGCPCGSGLNLVECCGPIVEGTVTAPTALRLMRSRYTAYALGAVDHLLRTWHPTTRPPPFEPDGRRRWLGLDILGTTGGGLLQSTGTVEFVAHFQDAGARRPDAQRENSRFTRVAGLWVYVDAL
ncbi:hypothetical protein JL107_03830 [Nakamurella flavida]|uniref:UPF0225 protein JL107_03830 n=1 Tax=Nakamurella flavida TaxID=363630 RepID=A0A938YI71_9ACTN|nr:YchJ family metal-binding protein [Nakamurella flavida]MBM9475569.1 hypothetical protein [Nakamurella flavida]MDP9778155.1 SEC-C motif-containing protein [Nakamurella flavida]